jgi:transcriptional regulator with XRE-family HTH domain
LRIPAFVIKPYLESFCNAMIELRFFSPQGPSTGPGESCSNALAQSPDVRFYFRYHPRMASRRPARSIVPATSTAAADPPAARSRRIGRPSNERFRQLFTRNLNSLLDQRADIPRESAARAVELARVCAVTPAAARKWLTGAGWPTLEKLLDLAQRYGFAPDDLLCDGPRRVVDISRLVDAQALRRAALAELLPVPSFDHADTLRLAIDPAAFSGAADPAAGAALVLVDIADDTMTPDCRAGDQVAVRLDPHWRGNGLYLLQATSTASPVIRRVCQTDEGYRIDTTGTGPGMQPSTVAEFAADEAAALDGMPILRGRPVFLLRTLPSGAGPGPSGG